MITSYRYWMILVVNGYILAERLSLTEPFKIPLVESLVLIVGERKAILPGWLGQENTFKYVQTSLKKTYPNQLFENPQPKYNQPSIYIEIIEIV